MFKKNILNFIIAGLLLVVAAIYFSKNDFNHSGPQNSIWDNVQVNNDPKPPVNPIVTPPDNTPREITTYEEALAEAKRTDKKILVVFGAEWCGWCRKLDTQTLKSQDVKKALADANTIEIHINTDQRKDLAKKYRVRGIPAYVLIDKNETELRSGSGYKDPANFINWLLGRWGTSQSFLSWLFGR